VVVQAEMLLYTIATNFPVVIVLVVLCLRLSTEVGKSTLPATLHFQWRSILH